MNDSIFLEKVIKKAIKNGWNQYSDYYENFESSNWIFSNDRISRGEYDDYEYVSINDIIFSHEFAKAFWGNERVNMINKTVDKCFMEYGIHPLCSFPLYRWQFHLTEMVLQKEPLKYLEKFLDK